MIDVEVRRRACMRASFRVVRGGFQCYMGFQHVWHFPLAVHAAMPDFDSERISGWVRPKGSACAGWAGASSSATSASSTCGTSRWRRGRGVTWRRWRPRPGVRCLVEDLHPVPRAYLEARQGWKGQLIDGEYGSMVWRSLPL